MIEHKRAQAGSDGVCWSCPRCKTTKSIRHVSVSVFSADISKSEEISRWRPIDKTLHYDFSATSGVATPGPVRACALVVFFQDPPCFNYNYVYSP